jgi:ATPases involved in chromosome partitioning
MNADDAFGKLMQSNKLAIPVAKPEQPEKDVAQFLDHLESAVSPAFDQNDFTETDFNPLDSLPVTDAMDLQPDYVPAANGEDTTDEKPEKFPTVTDALPVLDNETDTVLDHNLEDAFDEGAVIMGRDMPNPISQRLIARPEAEPEPTLNGIVRLAKARRVRRFAQLPLIGADKFEAEARELCANLAAVDPQKPSLLITSSGRGQGRTELAIRLSLAMARRVGARILLIDFDLKNPRVATRLGIPMKYFALADVLHGTCPLEEALVVSEEDNLYVLPARPSDRDGDDILNTHQAENLLDSVHRAFDFVILDCGPASQSETVALCRNVGFTALAAFSGLATRGNVERTGAKLEAAGARIAGVLLAGAR